MVLNYKPLLQVCLIIHTYIHTRIHLDRQTDRQTSLANPQGAFHSQYYNKTGIPFKKLPSY